jgi:hypothetical protein
MDMKTTVILTFSCFFWINIVAQSPQAFKYQAVARDASGNVLANRNLSFRISILSGSTSGTLVYSETHTNKITNDFGLAELEIGNGTVLSGTFSAIPWGTNSYYIKVEMDPAGGSSFIVMGTSQFLSVPYAIYAKKAENGFSGNYSDLTNKPSFANVASSGNYNDLSNRPVTDGSETKIAAGTNITLNGSGTTANPYKINAVSNHYPGELSGGGVVFYVDRTGEHGLIVSMTDLNPEKWSNVNDSIGTAAKSPWNGQSNTNAIIAQAGHTTSAAKLCDDYTNINYGTGIFSDWFLPAISQLSQLYSNIYEVNKTLENDGNSSTTSVYYKPYWSSTENWNIYARGYACFFNFETCTCDRYSKSNPLVIRAVRSF